MSASVVDDETSAVRRAIEEERAMRADLSERLEAVPGWLRVGDPDRFANDEDRGAAHEAAALLAELEERTARLARHEQRLDQLLSPVPPNPPPHHPHYGVLLPLRLETRFSRPDDQHPAWRLKVRVEPDPVSLPAGAATATDQEAALVAELWRECAGDLTTPEGETAFTALCTQVGGGRAAYLLRSVTVDRDGERFAVVGDPAPPVPPVLGLPRQLEIWGDSGTGPVRLATLQPDHERILATFGLAAVTPDADGAIPRTWWNSYAEAESVGLACTIDLDESEPHLGVLLAVGINQPFGQEPTVRQVVEGHAAAGALGTLAPLTATNTVDGQPTVDLGRDPGPWLDVVRRPPSDLAGLNLLTGSPLVPGVPAPDTARTDAASALVRALWPVLWQRSFKDIAGMGEEVYRLGEYAGRHLHPLGPLPVLRVGDLPYGVLPVASYRQWTSGGDEPPFEGTQVRVATDVVDALWRGATSELTAQDADVDGLLRVLAQTPTARAYGSRSLAPTVVWAAVQAALTGADPAEVVALWDAGAETLLRAFEHPPRRRYSPALFVEPWPDDVHPDYRRAMRGYLHAAWPELAEVNDLGGLWDVEGRPPHPLARLVRHSLLLTNVEVCRLFSDSVPDPRPTSYLLPLHDPQQLYQDATDLADTREVREVPAPAVALVDGTTGPPSSRNSAVVRQFEDVRAAVQQVIDTDPTVTDAVLTGVLDAAGHRADVWLTAAATRRLRHLSTLHSEPVLGAYGWVDDLRPSGDPTPPTRAGLVHAPSYSQALAAAVLRDHVVHDEDDTRWQMQLSSTTVRGAAVLAEQVRSGVPLPEVLGREIEKRVAEPAHVLELRRTFPARPEWAGRRVCDGGAVLDAAPGDLPAFLPASTLDDLRAALDAYADLLVTDAVHDVVGGRADAARESLEAAAGLAAPPGLRLLATPHEGGTVRTDVAFVLPYEATWEAAGSHPVEVADPAFTRFVRAECGPPRKLTWTSASGSVSLRELGLAVPDLLVLGRSGVEALAAARLGPLTGGTGSRRVDHAGRLAAMLASPHVRGPAAADVLRGRLTRLRAMAAALSSSLDTAGPAQLRSWNLGDDPAAAALELASRFSRVGDAAQDVDADADVLADLIRTLVATSQPLPLVCPDDVPPTVAGADWLDTWLPVVAAVRPTLAAVEAAQLRSRRTWQVRGSRPDPWEAPPLTPDGIAGDLDISVCIGPGVGQPEGTAVVHLDSWAETVPAPRHTTWTAFGYDAPRARAPQAVLVVVPSWESVDVDEARRAVLTARRLTQARSVAVTPEDLSTGLPTGVVEAVGSAACTLTESPLP